MEEEYQGPAEGCSLELQRAFYFPPQPVVKHGMITRLRRVARQIAASVGRRALILLYHRVADLRTDPWSLAVTPTHFAEHLEVLRRHLPALRLGHVVNGSDSAPLPRRAAVLTFDDGYADNLHAGKPLLERYEVPATVFVASGYVGARKEFWWDDLERILLQAGSLPSKLSLVLGQRFYSLDLSEVSAYSEEAASQYRSWKAWEAPPTPRHALYQTLCKKLRSLTADERGRVLAQLVTWAGLDSAGRPTHRTLMTDELLDLAGGGLVDIGAHTVTHPALAAMRLAVQRGEIERSKAHLEELLGRQVTGFAYPFGGRQDYTVETTTIVRAAGFSSAAATAGGVVGHSTDRYQLPRIHVPDCDGDQFARLLSRWLPR